MLRPVSNPPNPWDRTRVEWLGPPPEARLEVYEESAKSALSKNDSPDLPFTFGINPYRGCQHACAYCYARPTHQYLGYGAGTDFERRIVVKVDIAEALRRDLSKRTWKREAVAFCGVTDGWQPLEATYGLSRACLEVCHEFRTPVVVVTKSALIRRDADLLARMAARAGAAVYVSIPFADEELGRAIEPGAPTPTQRFESLRVLAEAGVPTGVSVSPVVPGLSDTQVPAVLERAKEAGVDRAFLTLLRLPAEVADVFQERLEEALPERAAHVMSALTDARGGRLRGAGFGERMRGDGPRWKLIRDLFALHCRRLGLSWSPEGGAEPPRPAKVPEVRQGDLFPS